MLVRPESSWNLPPTDKQMRRVTLLRMRHHILDDSKPANRLEANRIINRLRRRPCGRIGTYI